MDTSLEKKKSFILFAKHCEASLSQFNPLQYDCHLCALLVIPALRVSNCFCRIFCSLERRVILELHLIHATLNPLRNMSGGKRCDYTPYVSHCCFAPPHDSSKFRFCYSFVFAAELIFYAQVKYRWGAQHKEFAIQQ